MRSSDIVIPTSLLGSTAHSEFCERCNGIDLCQMSTMTKGQFQYLLEALSLSPGEKVLDAGCGTGKIAHTIASKTGVDLLAIDKEPDLIFEASLAFGNSVTFQELDIDHMPWVGRMFEVIYSIDALNFLTHLEASVRKLYQLLENGGRMAIFWSQTIAEGSERRRLEAEQTDLAHAFRKLNVTIEVRDFTDEEQAFWLKAGSLLQDMRESFLREGRKEFHRRLEERASHALQMLREDRMRRYFYLIRKDVP